LETVIVAFSSLGGVIIGLFYNYFKEKQQIKQQNYQTKREVLTEVYKELISIINSYPNKSPNDIMRRLEDSPNYGSEWFDAVLNSLGYRIEDKQKQLRISNIDYSRKNNLETDLSNLEYAKKEIIKNRDKYFLAKEKYENFQENEKMIFDLYAGQEVQNKLVHFEVVIQNVFISGMVFGDADSIEVNVIERAKRNLIYVMRKDVGMS
jgi:hypothetical protein